MLTREMAPVGTMVRVVRNTVCHGFKIGAVVRVDSHPRYGQTGFRSYDSRINAEWFVKYSECELVDMGPFDVEELL